MKKQLLIIGCHLDTEVKQDIVRKNLRTLKDKFDILLSSHFQIPVDIQAEAKYVVYNSNNELEKRGGFLVWYKYQNVYQQWHVESSCNPSYAVYQLIRPAAMFAKGLGYESFVYLEGDLLVGDTDVDKLLDLKVFAVTENKRATFFNGLRPWWDCQVFYSEIDFFIHSTPVLNSFQEFVSYCDRIGSEDFLEALLYKSLYVPNQHRMKELPSEVQRYFENSLLNLTQINIKYTTTMFEMSQVNESNNYTQYNVSLLRHEDTDKIYLTYRRVSKISPILDIYIDNVPKLSVREDTEFLYTDISVEDSFTIKLLQDGKLVQESIINKSDIINNPDFIRFL